MANTRWLVPMTFALIAASSLTAAPGPRFYVTVVGEKQGQFHGESPSAKWQQAMVGLKVSYESGGTGGSALTALVSRKRFLALTITKEWGAASPQLFQALVTNESLKSVVLQFIGPSAGGAEQVSHTIRLTNATVAGIRQYVDEDPRGAGGIVPLEDVTFTYQNIAEESGSGGVRPILRPIDRLLITPKVVPPPAGQPPKPAPGLILRQVSPPPK